MIRGEILFLKNFYKFFDLVHIFFVYLLCLGVKNFRIIIPRMRLWKTLPLCICINYHFCWSCSIGDQFIEFVTACIFSSTKRFSQTVAEHDISAPGIHKSNL